MATELFLFQSKQILELKSLFEMKVGPTKNEAEQNEQGIVNFSLFI